MNLFMNIPFFAILNTSVVLLIVVSINNQLTINLVGQSACDLDSELVIVWNDLITILITKVRDLISTKIAVITKKERTVT